MSKRTFPIVVEVGQKRVIAQSVDWPGWCRVSRSPQEALHALMDCAPRYQRVMQALDFHTPEDPAALQIVEELKGSSGTDFGVPAVIPTGDWAVMDAAEIARALAVLNACWDALEAALAAAGDKTLRKGPRGGGRDQDKIAAHVLDSQVAYLKQIGWKMPAAQEGQPWIARLPGISTAVEQAIGAAARGELPKSGPRGGVYWPARYFVRRAAWHILDHVWEIEDRIQ